MKITVLIIGIIGSLMIGALGITWLGDYNDGIKKFDEEMKTLEKNYSDPVKGLSEKEIADMGITQEKIDNYKKMFQEEKTKLEEEKSKVEKYKNESYILIIICVISLILSIISFKLPYKITAIVFIILGILPAFFNAAALIFSFLIIVAGVLAFLVKPKKVAA